MSSRFLLLAIALFAVACPAPSKTPPTTAEQQATFRAAVVITARAINESDKACAFIARSKVEDDIAAAKSLAAKCDAAYDKARDALIAVDDLIDGFDSKNTDKVVCGLMVATQQLSELIALLDPAVSDAMRDAVQFVSPIAKSCPNYKPASDAGSP